MSQNFFRELEAAREVLSGRSQQERDKHHALGMITLNELQTFVLSCVWKDTEKTRQLMRYIDLRAVDAAKKMKVSEHTVRSARSQASSRLFYIFGEKVFEGIICGDMKICFRTRIIIHAINDGYTQVENYIPDVIRRELDVIPEIGDIPFESKQFERELNFIKNYSIISMMKEFNTLDKNKLRYLYGILRQPLFDFKENRPVNEEKLNILKMLYQKS